MRGRGRRKPREDALLALELERAQLRTLIRAMPDLVWAKDGHGRYIACNAAFERLYGIAEEDLLGKTLDQVTDPETAAVRQAGDDVVLGDGSVEVTEMLLAFADGYEGTFEVIRAPVRDGSGAIMGLVGIGRDITETRRNERELGERVKEQRCLYEVYRLTEEAEPDFGEVLPLVAAVLKAAWQYPEIAETSIEWRGERYCTPGYRETPWLQTAAARTKAGEEVSVTVAYTEEAPAEHEVLFLAEEQTLLEAVVARLVDTVDWAQASREQADHEQMLATMFAQSTDAILLFDPETGEFIDFNFEAHAGLGYTREEFAGMTIADFQAEHDLEDIGDNTGKALAGAMVDLQTVHRHKDGRLIDVAVTLRVVTLQGRRYLSAVWRDVTEQRAHERELLETAELLRLQNGILGQIGTSGSMADGRFEEFAAEVTESLARSLGIPSVSVWLFSEDGSRLECVDVYDRAAARHSRDLVIETAAFPEEMRAHRAARYVDAGDALTDPRTAGFGEGLVHRGRATALLDAAIVSAGRVRGLLSIGRVDGPEEWSSDETSFACQVADQLGMALLNRDR